MEDPSIEPTGTLKQCLYGSSFCRVKPHETFEVCITCQSQAHSTASLFQTWRAIFQMVATRLLAGIPNNLPFNW